MGGEDLDEPTGPFSGIQEKSLNKFGKTVLRNCHSHLDETLHYLVSFTLKKCFYYCIYISYGNLHYPHSSGAHWLHKMPSCVLYVKSHRIWELLWSDFYFLFAAAAKLLQSCPTLCNPIDGLLPGSSVPGILQARTLEWAAISFSNAWKWKVKVKLLSRVWLLATPWTAAYQAPPSIGIFQARVLEWDATAFPTSSLDWLIVQLAFPHRSCSIKHHNFQSIPYKFAILVFNSEDNQRQGWSVHDCTVMRRSFQRSFYAFFFICIGIMSAFKNIMWLTVYPPSPGASFLRRSDITAALAVGQDIERSFKRRIECLP